jgi:hypothetical protein
VERDVHEREGQGRNAPLRGAWLAALIGVRSHRAIAAVVAAALSAAVAALLPVAGVFQLGWGGLQPGLRLPARPGDDPELAWTTAVQLPIETRQHAVDTLAAMLLATALATLAVAVVTIIALAAAREARHADIIPVQRAVGASRRTLRSAALLEAALLVFAGVGLGLVAGLPLARAGVARWPGAVHSNLLAAAPGA